MSCDYCLSKDMSAHRPAGLMSFETFKKVVKVIEQFHKQGTQKELWLHGTGESLLNKDLVRMVRYLKERVPIDIGISSNGLLLDADMIFDLKEAGMNRIDVSCHDEEVGVKAHHMVKSYGIFSLLNRGAQERPFNWAGQLDVKDAITYAFDCPWISNKECMVLHDGSIVTCCFDAYGTKILGTIDDDVSQLEIKRFDLCEKCNHTT